MQQNDLHKVMAHRTYLFSIAFLLAIAIGLPNRPGNASTHTSFDQEESQEIERIVRDYIKRNPEIILDALKDIQERQRLAKIEASRRLIMDNRSSLLDDPGSPVAGNVNGDVTIVEFFDYRCPYCRRVAPEITRLLEQDENVRLIYKEWPILGPISVVAARAALAAWKQGQYPEFHERLMQFPGQLSERAIFATAESLGLDIETLREDMASSEVDVILERNRALADSLGITGTPAFVVGDDLIPGAVKLADLKSLLEKIREGS